MLLVMENDLTELTSGVWEAFLGMSADPVSPETPIGGRVYTSYVNISGGWEGCVSIVIPEPLARQVAGAMFGMDDGELGSAEVADAVGELANIIGGNIKGMIEEPSALSLPMVAVGTDYAVVVPGTELVQSVVLESNGVAFQIAVARSTAS